MSTEMPVTAAFYRTHRDPQNNYVQIRYLPENPEIAQIEGENANSPTVLWLGVAFLLPGLWMGRRIWLELAA